MGLFDEWYAFNPSRLINPINTSKSMRKERVSLSTPRLFHLLAPLKTHQLVLCSHRLRYYIYARLRLKTAPSPHLDMSLQIFSPIDKMLLVGIIMGEQTDDTT